MMMVMLRIMRKKKMVMVATGTGASAIMASLAVHLNASEFKYACHGSSNVPRR